MSEHLSAAQILASLPVDERDRQLAKLTVETKAFLACHWPFLGPADQPPPGHPKSDRPNHPGRWLTWLALAGRGFGKTRMASEWIRMKVCGPTSLSGTDYTRIAVVAETAADCRDVMVEGPSGILAVHPPSVPSRRARHLWSFFNLTRLFSVLRGSIGGPVPKHDTQFGTQGH